MSTTKADNAKVSSNTEDLELSELVKLREEIDAKINNKRPQAISEFFNKLVDFCSENNLGLKEFLEIGERGYQSEHKKKKSPLFIPFTTGTERKLPIKYSDSKNHWSGRGKTPKWLKDYVAEGRSMEEFLVK